MTTHSSSTVSYEVAARRAAITSEIAAAVERADDDPAVRVIVLQGAGRSFRAGAEHR